MKYKNTKTGAVIDSPCSISGKNWEPLQEVQEAVPEPKPEDDTVDLSLMTVAELKQFALDLKIDLGTAARKGDIIKIIAASDNVEVE